MKTSKILPKSVGACVAGLLLACASPALAAPVTLVNETFSSISNNTQLNTAGWYYQNDNGAGTAWQVRTSDYGGLTANMPFNQGGTATNTLLVKNFTTASLAEIGSSLTVSLDVRANSRTFDDPTKLFAVSLLNSGTLFSSNTYGSLGALAGATGYDYSQQLQDTTASLNEISGGTTRTTLVNVTAQEKISNGNIQSYSLTLTRVSNGMALSIVMNGLEIGSFVDTSVAASAFNTLVIRANGIGGGSSVNPAIDNVRVEYSSIPEPASAAVLAGGGVLALAATLRRNRAR